MWWLLLPSQPLFDLLHLKAELHRYLPDKRNSIMFHSFAVLFHAPLRQCMSAFTSKRFLRLRLQTEKTPMWIWAHVEKPASRSFPEVSSSIQPYCYSHSVLSCWRHCHGNQRICCCWCLFNPLCVQAWGCVCVRWVFMLNFWSGWLQDLKLQAKPNVHFVFWLSVIFKSYCSIVNIYIYIFY